MADQAAPGPFAPYVKSINADDPLMKRVPFPHMDIGANVPSMPNNLMIGERPPSIEHVGGSVRKGG